MQQQIKRPLKPLYINDKPRIGRTLSLLTGPDDSRLRPHKSSACQPWRIFRNGQHFIHHAIAVQHQITSGA